MSRSRALELRHSAAPAVNMAALHRSGLADGLRELVPARGDSAENDEEQREHGRTTGSVPAAVRAKLLPAGCLLMMASFTLGPCWGKRSDGRVDGLMNGLKTQVMMGKEAEESIRSQASFYLHIAEHKLALLSARAVTPHHSININMLLSRPQRKSPAVLWPERQAKSKIRARVQAPWRGDVGPQGGCYRRDDEPIAGGADGREHSSIRKFLSQHHKKLPWKPEGFTVSVGAIARQWVRRAAICQCLAASRNAEGCTRSLRKGGSLPEEGGERGRESDLLVRLMERADAKERERRY
ncbi:hypothetical protein EYF80_001902 [Liparis tanakae]|uniref:Uncharacterized protein n=1 Tax=Liparis tanakae TaxID=230148 RepID=A0A4Z2JE49_9TELE|nr:hypothetical protein EYF80_001902 [Liparis tanakae]